MEIFTVSMQKPEKLFGNFRWAPGSKVHRASIMGLLIWEMIWEFFMQLIFAMVPFSGKGTSGNTFVPRHFAMTLAYMWEALILRKKPVISGAFPEKTAPLSGRKRWLLSSPVRL